MAAVGNKLWRAWELKEDLRDLYRVVDPADAPAYLKAWCTSALRSRIKAFTNLVRRIRKHFDAIIAAIQLGLSNTRLEGINARSRPCLCPGHCTAGGREEVIGSYGVIAFMRWNQAAFEVLGGPDELTEACDELAVLEGWLRGPLPEAVREWYLLGGDRRLASIGSNLVTVTRDFTSRTVSRFLDNGYLLLETDSQLCCRWVVAISAVYGDPPVYLIDPDDDACATRSRYANSFPTTRLRLLGTRNSGPVSCLPNSTTPCHPMRSTRSTSGSLHFQPPRDGL